MLSIFLLRNYGQLTLVFSTIVRIHAVFFNLTAVDGNSVDDKEKNV